MSYSTMIKEKINQYSELEIIDAQQLYTSQFENVPEHAFYKTISRLTQSKEIERLTKGIYCKPKIGRFGKMISSEKNILEYYLGMSGNKGVVVGYRMFNKYKLTSQISKGVEVYSNKTEQEKKKVLNVEIKNANLKFDVSTIKMIELINFLENYYRIEDLNKYNAKLFIEDAVTYYNDKTLDKLIKMIGYKKSTLASLKNILDFYKVNHSISRYLNRLSNYKSISMETLNETTPE